MFNTCNTLQTWSGVWAQVNCFIQINITINGNISIGCWFLNNVGTITHQDVQTHYQMLLCTCFIHFIFHCTVKEFIIIWRRWEIVLRTKIIVSSGINGTGGDVIRFDAILHWFGLGSLSILSHFKNPVWENNKISNYFFSWLL